MMNKLGAHMRWKRRICGDFKVYYVDVCFVEKERMGR
jgi:hypothetical protein